MSEHARMQGVTYVAKKAFLRIYQYLVIARGSVSEVKSLSYASLDIGYTTPEQFTGMIDRCTALSGLINGFIRYLKTSTRKK